MPASALMRPCASLAALVTRLAMSALTDVSAGWPPSSEMLEFGAAGEPASIWLLRSVAAPCCTAVWFCGLSAVSAVLSEAVAFCRCTSSAAAAFAAAALWVAAQSWLAWFWADTVCCCPM